MQCAFSWILQSYGVSVKLPCIHCGLFIGWITRLEIHHAIRTVSEFRDYVEPSSNVARTFQILKFNRRGSDLLLPKRYGPRRQLLAEFLCSPAAIVILLKASDDAENTRYWNRWLRDTMLNLENKAVLAAVE